MRVVARERLPSKLSDEEVGLATMIGCLSMLPYPATTAIGTGCDIAEKLGTGAVCDTAKSVICAALLPKLSVGIR